MGVTDLDLNIKGKTIDRAYQGLTYGLVTLGGLGPKVWSSAFTAFY